MLFSFLRLKKIIYQKSQKAEKIRVFFAFLFARDFSGMTRFFSSSSPEVQYERIMSLIFVTCLKNGKNLYPTTKNQARDPRIFRTDAVPIRSKQ